MVIGITELAEQFKKNEEAIIDNNIILSLKDFMQRQDYEVHIETYLSSGNKYLIIEGEELKTVYNLRTGEFWGCNEWIKEMK